MQEVNDNEPALEPTQTRQLLKVLGDKAQLDLLEDMRKLEETDRKLGLAVDTAYSFNVYDDVSDRPVHVANLRSLLANDGGSPDITRDLLFTNVGQLSVSEFLARNWRFELFGSYWFTGSNNWHAERSECGTYLALRVGLKMQIAFTAQTNIACTCSHCVVLGIRFIQ